MMRYAASKRAHYIDLRGPIGLEEAVAKAVGDVSPVVLMGAGYCPGAIAPLLKLAINKLATCSAAHLSIAATALPSQADEAIEAMMCGTRLEDWHHGTWAAARPSQPTFAQKTDFGDGKMRQTTPVGVVEVPTGVPQRLAPRGALACAHPRLSLRSSCQTHTAHPSLYSPPFSVFVCVLAGA